MELSWGQLNQAVQLATRTGGKKAAVALDQKLGKAKQDTDAVAELINRLEQGSTVLHRACESGEADTLLALLGRGGSPNVLNHDGETPLLACLRLLGQAGPGGIVASKPTVKKFERLCGMLLEHPGFVLGTNGTCGRARDGPVHLCVARDFDRKDALLPLLQLFLGHGFDPSAQPRGEDGGVAFLPALHSAVHHGHHKCAAALVEAGADTDARASVGDSTTPVTAIEMCEAELAAQLKRLAAVQKAKVKVLGTGQSPALVRAEPEEGGGGSAAAAGELDEATVARIHEVRSIAAGMLEAVSMLADVGACAALCIGALACVRTNLTSQEAKAERKRQKNREKKKKKKQAQAQAEPVEAVGGAVAVAGGAIPKLGALMHTALHWAEFPLALAQSIR
jgi:hypothetical protein